MRIKSKKGLMQLIVNKEIGIVKSAAMRMDDNNKKEADWYRGYLDACVQIYDSIENLCVEF